MTKSFFCVHICCLFFVCCFGCYSQEKKVLFGFVVGLNNTPNSLQNLTAFGGEFGFSFLYKANRKYELQTNLNYYSRTVKIILEKYDTYSGKMFTSLRIKYEVIEIPILVHYKFREKGNARKLKFVFGVSVSFNNIKNYSISSQEVYGVGGEVGTASIKGYNGQNKTGNLIVGLSKLKKFKKDGKQFYSLTLLYQKALNRAPKFEAQGVKPHSQQAYNIRSASYLDMFSLTFTYFPFSTKVK